MLCDFVYFLLERGVLFEFRRRRVGQRPSAAEGRAIGDHHRHLVRRAGGGGHPGQYLFPPLLQRLQEGIHRIPVYEKYQGLPPRHLLHGF